VVSTSIGCQGLEVIDGKHLLIADNETDFSRRVIELLRDRERAETLAAAGRRLAEERYDWSRIISDLAPKLEDLVRGACGRAEGGTQRAMLRA
jgi:glycosyltransferase involved in cell wall biosynthesis